MADLPSIVAYPEAVASLGTGPVDPVSVTISGAINSYPTATMVYQPSSKTDSLLPAAPETLASELVASQSNMFGQAATAFVNAKDGLGGEITFSGFQTNSAYSIMVGNTGFQGTMIHRAAALDSLDTTIYNTGKEVWREYTELPESGELYGTWLQDILDHVIEKWQTNRTNNPLDEYTNGIRTRQHANNTLGLQTWNEILEASTAVNSELPTLADATSGGFREDFARAVINIYFASYGSFNQTMQQFANQFNMMYIPSLTANSAGRYVNIRYAVGEAEGKTAKISSMSLSSGSKSILPITQVLVKGIPSPRWRSQYANDIPSTAIAPHISAVPTDVTYGGFYSVSSPSWLPLETHPIADDEGKNPPDLDAYEDSKETRDNEYREDFSRSVLAVCDEWGKDIYVDRALRDSTCSLIVALDFSWEIGKVYTVSVEEGPELFTGFLAGLTHSLSSNHSSPQAETHLSFTHVRAPGFELPGL